MKFLLFISTVLLIRPAKCCEVLQDNVSSFSPYDSEGYDEGVQVTMTCTDTYITSWASTVDDTEGSIKCVSLSWVPEPLVEGFDREVGCVECIQGSVDCQGGVCIDGECVCNENLVKSPENPRLCQQVQCPSLTLSNQEAQTSGPYDVNTEVTVTCSTGYHVQGDNNSTVQVLTCGDDGIFSITLEGCVVCSDSADCTDGDCNANNVCECDKARSYRLSNDDPRLCEKVQCPEDHCSNNGACSVRGTELQCTCQPGTTGETCTEFTSVDPCGDDPCKNNSTCNRNTTDFSTHTCTCVEGYTGENCEDPPNENSETSDAENEGDGTENREETKNSAEETENSTEETDNIAEETENSAEETESSAEEETEDSGEEKENSGEEKTGNSTEEMENSAEEMINSGEEKTENSENTTEKDDGSNSTGFLHTKAVSYLILVSTGIIAFVV
ncbi:hypothetical protein ACHWQZ_G016699 [Mnemiopsis leidyi]